MTGELYQNSTGPTVRRWVFFTGRVQGVGFRYTTRQVAQDFAVTGFVRNLPDGRVELVAEGTPSELGRFLDAVHDAMAGNIRHTEVREQSATGQFESFDVAR